MKKITLTLTAALALAGMCLLGSTRQTPYPEIAGYHLDIDARPVVGIKKNLSALAWNPDTATLFGAINRPPQVVELSPEGQLLRTIQVSGIQDLEAIEHIQGNQFVLADERRHHLFAVTITPTTRALDVSSLAHITLNLEGRNNNSGFEGLTWNSRHRVLLVAQEKNPLKLFQVSGFPLAQPDHNLAVKVITQAGWMARLKDISALHYDTRHDRLLVLSDESKTLLFIPASNDIKQLSLTEGKHGLKQTIPQPEGVAADDRGHIYVTSEPNLFYRFTANEDEDQ